MEEKPTSFALDTLERFSIHIDRVLRIYKGRNGVQTNGQGTYTECSYVPSSSLRHFWKTSTTGRIKALLRSYQPFLSVPADHVRDRYLRVLSLLAYVNEVSYLPQFLQKKLDDGHFPTENRPYQLREKVHDKIWEAIKDAQWAFFPLELDEIGHDRRLSVRHILPFSNPVPLVPQSRSSMVYSVEVPDLGSPPEKQFPNPEVNRLVLKTYFGSPPNPQYRNEIRAQTVLKELRSPNIVGFEGCFQQGETVNVLMRLANRGNLFEYMSATANPKTPEDILRFWKSFHTFLQGLHCIHQVESCDDGNHVGLVHQDVKPANIVLHAEPGSLDYEFTPLIADFGHSDLHLVTPSNADAPAVDHHGVQVYSAPEAGHYRDYQLKPPNRLSSQADIFSAGCVFIEVASWVVFGSGAPDSFLEMREAEARRKSSFDDATPTPYFHNGTAISPAVLECCRNIEAAVVKGDRVTGAIVGVALGGMVVFDRHQRLDAKTLADSIYLIIKDAEESMKLAGNTLGGLDSPDSPSPDRTTRTRPGLACIQPLGQSKPRPLSQGGSSSVVSSPPSTGRQTGTIPSSPMTLSPPSSPPSSHRLSLPGTRLQSSLNRHISAARDRARSSPGPWLHRDATSPTRPRSSNSGAAVAVATSSNSAVAVAVAAAASSAVPALRLKKLDREVSMDEAREWIKRKKKDGDAPDPAVDLAIQCLLSCSALQGRDYVFFVDNSPTMGQRRDDVVAAFSTLGYLAKTVDGNGIELILASELVRESAREAARAKQSVHHKDRTSPLVDYLSAADFDHDIEYIETAFKFLFNRVVYPMLGLGAQAGSPGPSASPRAQHKPLTIFVFTDGRWGNHHRACGVEVPVSKLVHRMHASFIDRTDVMIQFLRFGDDESGIRHLAYLDKFGNVRSGRDIVDTRVYGHDSINSIFKGAITQANDGNN